MTAGRDAVDAAVRAALDAKGFSDGGVLLDYVVVAAQGKLDDDGDLATSISIVINEGGSTHAAMGLLAFATARFHGLVGVYSNRDDD